MSSRAWKRKVRNVVLEAGETAQGLTAAKPDDPSFITGTHMVEEESPLPRAVT